MENTNVNEIIAKVQSSSEFGGTMYSQEQVINILKMVQCTKPDSICITIDALDKIDSHVDQIRDRFDNLYADLESAEFEIGYENRIELNSCEVYGQDDLEEQIEKLQELIANLRMGYEIETEN